LGTVPETDVLVVIIIVVYYKSRKRELKAKLMNDYYLALFFSQLPTTKKDCSVDYEVKDATTSEAYSRTNGEKRCRTCFVVISGPVAGRCRWISWRKYHSQGSTSTAGLVCNLSSTAQS
jgi:hypothetical protein